MGEMEGDKILNFANGITAFRALIGIFFVITFLQNSFPLFLFIYLVFALLDFIDGFVARKFHCETPFGRNFDIVIDALFLGTSALALLWRGMIPSLYQYFFLPPFLLYASTFLRGVYKAKKTFISSRWGKFNGLFMYVTVFLFLMQNTFFLTLAYAYLFYFYVASIKYVFEFRRPDKRIENIIS